MTGKQQKTAVAYFTISFIILSTAGIVWGMSSANTKRDMTVKFHEKRLHRLEVLIEKTELIPVMQSQINSIDKNIERIFLEMQSAK